MQRKTRLQNEKICFHPDCKRVGGLELHHIFFGRKHRPIADRLELTCWLCGEHHRYGKESAHLNKDFDLYLKRTAQTEFEKSIGTHEEFLSLFGRDYL